MRKLLLIPILFLLAACGAAEDSGPLTNSAVDDDPSPSGDIFEEAPESEPVSAESVAVGSTAAEAGVVRDRDWTKGAEDPLITIIEYGDFQ